MSPDQLFSVVSAVALLGWLLLAVAGRVRWIATLVTGAVIPLLLALVYAASLGMHWSQRTGGFGSISEVRALFSNDWLLLAGWVHYLAFDLFIGSWQVRDSQKYGIPHLAVIPGLILTFLFGPVGLLVYFALRVAFTRTLAVQD